VATPASGRQLFLDGLRGLALIFMVLNHTGRWWIERPLGWPRYHLVYLTVTLAAPIFLFLVGFCLPLSYLNSTLTRGERYVSVAWKYVRRGARLVVAGWFLNLLVFPDEPDTVEVAFVVEDGWQGRGLGTILVREVLDSAAARGARRFRAYVLSENRRMLGLIARFGDVRERKTEQGVTELLFTRREERER